MNKEEYLKKLDSYLRKQLSKEEIEDIIRDYGEYFEDGHRMNQSDIEIAARLGSPDIIAKQIIEEYGEDTLSNHSDELRKIKDKAKEGIFSVKEKITSNHLGKQIKKFPANIFFGFSTVFSKLFHSMGGALQMGKSLFLACFGLISSIAAGVIFLMAEMIGLLFYGFLLMTVLFLGGIGIFGIVASFVSIGFISIFLTMAALLISIISVCIGGLLLLLDMKLISINYKLIKWIFCKKMKFDLKEGDIDNV